MKILLMIPKLSCMYGKRSGMVAAFWAGRGCTGGRRSLGLPSGHPFSRLILHAWKQWTYSKARAYLINIYWLCHNDGHADPPSSKVSLLRKWLWMVRSALNRTGKIIKKFSDFYFLSYHRKLGWRRHKNDHNLKNKNRKIIFFFLFNRFSIFHEN